MSALPAIGGVYVQHLVTGCGAAVNAGARFPAASTLKAAILIEALRDTGGRPPPALGRLLDEMILVSNDRAANAVLASLGDGAGRVTSLLRALGLGESLVRGPYIIEDARRPLVISATSHPALYTNFVTTPYEIARLMVAVHRGAIGRGGVARAGLSPRTIRREVMTRLLSVRDRSKIVAGVPPGTPVAHKTGYTEEVKHDAGVVYLRRGPVVIAALAWSGSGVGDAVGNRFIARVTAAAVARLARGGSCRG